LIENIQLERLSSMVVPSLSEREREREIVRDSER
jgi:hypothetical protein